MVYVRWGETARIDYFRALGFFSSEDDKMKIILGFQSVKYTGNLSGYHPYWYKKRKKSERTDRPEIFYYSEKARNCGDKTHEVILFDFKPRKNSSPKRITSNKYLESI
jgi:acyl-CoA thioester hydrolase